jgi:hypothetical protein
LSQNLNGRNYGGDKNQRRKKTLGVSPPVARKSKECKNAHRASLAVNAQLALEGRDQFRLCRPVERTARSLLSFELSDERPGLEATALRSIIPDDTVYAPAGIAATPRHCVIAKLIHPTTIVCGTSRAAVEATATRAIGWISWIVVGVGR